MACVVVHMPQGPSITDFLTALNARYVSGHDPQRRACEEPGAFHWPDLDIVARRVFRAAPGVSCMLGPMDAKPKVGG
jgi:hypothetical protein